MVGSLRRTTGLRQMQQSVACIKMDPLLAFPRHETGDSSVTLAWTTGEAWARPGSQAQSPF
jgi:hypothetical protein